MTATRAHRMEARQITPEQWEMGEYVITLWQHPLGSAWVVWHLDRMVEISTTLRRAVNWIAKQNEGSGSR
jgi:hypothetical protein